MQNDIEKIDINDLLRLMIVVVGAFIMAIPVMVCVLVISTWVMDYYNWLFSVIVSYFS